MADSYWVTMPTAARLAGVSDAVLRRWHRDGIVVPEKSWERGRGYGRLYAFQDILALRIIAALRGYARLKELKRIQPWILSIQPPSLMPRLVDWEKYAVRAEQGQLLFFEGVSHPCDTNPGRQACVQVLPIVECLREEIERLKQRSPEEIGRVTRKRGVLGYSWILAGTRIPTSAVWDFYLAGYETDQIIEQYPSLQVADIEAAIAHERGLRRRDAA